MCALHFHVQWNLYNADTFETRQIYPDYGGDLISQVDLMLLH